MGKYFGTDGFRGEAGIDLTADHAYKVGRFLGWYYNDCASATATMSLPASSSARTPAAVPICSSTAWLLV